MTEPIVYATGDEQETEQRLKVWRAAHPDGAVTIEQRKPSYYITDHEFWYVTLTDGEKSVTGGGWYTAWKAYRDALKLWDAPPNKKKTRR